MKKLSLRRIQVRDKVEKPKTSLVIKVNWVHWTIIILSVSYILTHVVLYLVKE